jgi:hypothetical protein
MSQNSQNQQVEQLLIDGKDLAKMIDMPPRYVQVNASRILGSQRVGGRWKFNLDIIRRAVASGKNIVT